MFANYIVLKTPFPKHFTSLSLERAGGEALFSSLFLSKGVGGEASFSSFLSQPFIQLHQCGHENTQ